jgi:hypothetical protein
VIGQIDGVVDDIESGALSVVGESESVALDILGELRRTINEVTQDIDEKFKDHRGITIDSLDNLQSGVFRELERLLEETSLEIEKITTEITNSTLLVLRELNTSITQQREELEEVLARFLFGVVVGSTYIIDHTVDRILLIIGIGILAVIGIIIILLLSIWNERIPNVRWKQLLLLLFIVLFVAGGGSLLNQRIRSYLLVTSGRNFAQELNEVLEPGEDNCNWFCEGERNPEIYLLNPSDEINLGTITELLISGNELFIRNELVPKITIDGQELDFTPSYSSISIDLSTLQINDEGRYQLFLEYEEQGILVDELVNIIPLREPADLIIESIIIDPEHVQTDQNVTATINVCNIGDSDIERTFEVSWRPEPSVSPQRKNINNLSAGDCEERIFNHIYRISDSYEMFVIINADNISETNKANNQMTRNITILEPPTPTGS